MPAGGDLMAYDISNGQILWAARRVLPDGAPIEELACHEHLSGFVYEVDRVLASGERAASVCDVRNGRLLCISRRKAPWRLGGAHLTDDGLVVLYHRTQAVEAEGEPASQPTDVAVVEQFAVPRELAPRAPRESAPLRRLQKVQTRRLADPGDVERVLWSRDHVYLVGRDTIRAYTLPDPAAEQP